MKAVAEITNDMIAFFDGNRHEVSHMLKVWSYARTIGILENLDSRTQQILEIAALVHDIACPLCRKKYGSVRGDFQEKEGAVLVDSFLKNRDFPEDMIDRVVFLVEHHHTPDKIAGADYQILIEADYLVNADESRYSREEIKEFVKTYFKTASGSEMIEKIFNL